MFYILIILLLLVFYLFIENVISNDDKPQIEQFNVGKSAVHLENEIQNFMANPTKQIFCPNIYTNKAKYWTKLPEKYCKNYYVKTCCVSCYYKIARIITCSKNKDGMYKFGKITLTDIENLQKYYKENKLKSHFDFESRDLDKLIGKYSLKLKENKIYYPIQLLKKQKNMNEIDVDMLNNNIIEKEYNCDKSN